MRVQPVGPQRTVRICSLCASATLRHEGAHGALGEHDQVADSVVRDRHMYCCLTELESPLALQFGLVLLIGARGFVALNQDAEPPVVINPRRTACARWVQVPRWWAVRDTTVSSQELRA